MTSSPVRFTGLTSGMDTQSMVQQLMRAESMRMDRLTRRRTLLQWRQEKTRSTMTVMNEFRRTHTDANLGTRSINNPAAWNTTRATVTNANGSGNTKGITVNTSSSSAVGSFDIRVVQSAKGDLVRGRQFMTSPGFTTLVPGDGPISELNLSTTLSHFLERGGVNNSILSTETTYVQIGNANIRVRGNYTTQQLMNLVNENSTAGVNMRFDTIRGRFILEARGTGANALVRTGSDDWGLLEHMGLQDIRSGPSGSVGNVVTGTPQNAPVLMSTVLNTLTGVYDGQSMTIGGHSFTLEVNEALGSFIGRVNAHAGVDFQIGLTSGRFWASGNSTASVIETGSGALLHFMGLENIVPTLNPAYVTGVNTEFMPIDLPGISGSSNWADILTAMGSTTIFSQLALQDPDNPPSADAEFTIRIGRYTQEASSPTHTDITINSNTTVLDFFNEANATATDDPEHGIHVEFDLTDVAANRINIRAAQPGGEIAISQYPGGNNVLQLFGITSQVQMQISVANLPPSVSGNLVTPALNARIADLPFYLGAESFEINGETVTIGANYTFQDVISRVNNTPGIGVQISFNASTGAFSVEATESGNLAQINTDNSTILTFMGLSNITWSGNVALSTLPDGSPNFANDERIVRHAQNAIIHYDVNASLGHVVMEQENNSFEIHGIRINLTNAVETRAADGTGGVFTITAKRDTEDIMNAIREFVEAYNDLIRYLNALHTTPRPRAGNSARGAVFEPLTDEQRQGMSDREIERWEEQARTGLFHRDRDIRNIQQQLRNAMFSPIVLERDSETGRILDSIFLFQVGITTVGRAGASSDQLIGVLQIDENRLRAALEENPERVQALFASTGGNRLWGNMEQRNTRMPYVGLGFRIDDILNNVASDTRGVLQQRAGYNSGLMVSENLMTRQLRDYDRRIEQMQQFLIRRENHFFAMFAKMEAAMSQSHAQMDALVTWSMQQ